MRLSVVLSVSLYSKIFLIHWIVGLYAYSYTRPRLHLNVISKRKAIDLSIMTENGSEMNVVDKFMQNTELSNKYSANFTNLIPKHSIVVKSLIWICDGSPVLVVLEDNKYVDRFLLAEILCINDVQLCHLASLSQAEVLSGCRVGTIPCIPMVYPDMMTVIDLRLMEDLKSMNQESIYSGSGLSGRALTVNIHGLTSSLLNMKVGYVSTTIATSNVTIKNDSTSQTITSYVSNKTCSVNINKTKQNSQNNCNKSHFAFSTLRKLAASNETDKFIKLLGLYDSLNLDQSSIDEPTGSGKTALQLG